MAQDNTFSAFLKSNDISKFFDSYQAVPFDFQSLLETQRKNLQSFSEAQQLLIGNIQAIAQRQAEIVSHMMHEQSEITQELMREGTPEEKMAKNAQIFKKSYEQAMTNLSEISDMVKTSNTQASSLLNKRLSASMKEIQGAIDTSKKKVAA
ncbi:MAG: phasin family protein [Alphaproteobacteria bacterium]|nr:phasin family protein [Alphaproteobacteria bacterium]